MISDLRAQWKLSEDQWESRNSDEPVQGDDEEYITGTPICSPSSNPGTSPSAPWLNYSIFYDDCCFPIFPSYPNHRVPVLVATEVEKDDAATTASSDQLAALGLTDGVTPEKAQELANLLAEIDQLAEWDPKPLTMNDLNSQHNNSCPY